MDLNPKLRNNCNKAKSRNYNFENNNNNNLHLPIKHHSSNTISKQPRSSINDHHKHHQAKNFGARRNNHAIASRPKSTNNLFVISSNAKASILILLLSPLFSDDLLQFGSSTFLIGECDFERYATGCYSQANLICDIETNTCKCQPESPILIEERLCVKRLKLFDVCLYNEQCDIYKGIYCAYSDLVLINSTNTSHGQQQNHHHQHQYELNRSSSANRAHKSEIPRCRQIYTLDINGRLFDNAERLPLIQDDNSSNSDNINNNYDARYPQPTFGSSGKNLHGFDNLQTYHKTQHHQSASSRLVWVLVIGSIVGVIILLAVFFKNENVFASQPSRAISGSRRALTNDVINQISSSSSSHQSRLRVDQTSEIDNPPPYEVAIRMNLTCHEGTYTSRHDYKNQSPCNPCKYLADNPS